MTCDAHVKVKVAFVTAYHYDYTGSIWKAGRLVSLKSTCDDDGKKFEVNATAGEKGLTLKVNGREKAVDAATCIHRRLLPAGRQSPRRAIPLLEADNAEEIAGKLQRISSGPMNVAGQVMTVTRYRLTSLVAHDVWSDSSDRIGAQEWTEEGHKTVLELASLKK